MEQDVSFLQLDLTHMSLQDIMKTHWKKCSSAESYFIFKIVLVLSRPSLESNLILNIKNLHLNFIIKTKSKIRLVPVS